jgi:beta-glucanase (GH16 family)
MQNNYLEQINTEVLFFDDFSTKELDRSKWNVRVTGKTVNGEQQAYLDSPETIYVDKTDQEGGNSSGGVLTIHPRYHPDFLTNEGKQFDFISGRIDTRGIFDFQYGTAAARMRLPEGIGFWPAFWAMGIDKWPEAGEIDIMENVGDRDWISGGIHGPGYSGEQALINQVYLPSQGDITNWHIYSVEWHPTYFLFRVDGNLYYRVTKQTVNFFGEWVFDDPKYLILNLAIGGKYPYKIHRIEEPYYGLPDQTVEIIKDNQARLLIDWVKVTKNEMTIDIPTSEERIE